MSNQTLSTFVGLKLPSLCHDYMCLVTVQNWNFTVWHCKWIPCVIGREVEISSSEKKQVGGCMATGSCKYWWVPDDFPPRWDLGKHWSERPALSWQGNSMWIHASISWSKRGRPPTGQRIAWMNKWCTSVTSGILNLIFPLAKLVTSFKSSSSLSDHRYIGLQANKAKTPLFLKYLLLIYYCFCNVCSSVSFWKLQ